MFLCTANYLPLKEAIIFLLKVYVLRKSHYQVRQKSGCGPIELNLNDKHFIDGKFQIPEIFKKWLL